MRAFLLAMVVMAAISVGAYYGLNSGEFVDVDRSAGADVRLD